MVRGEETDDEKEDIFENLLFGNVDQKGRAEIDYLDEVGTIRRTKETTREGTTDLPNPNLSGLHRTPRRASRT